MIDFLLCLFAGEGEIIVYYYQLFDYWGGQFLCLLIIYNYAVMNFLVYL